MGQLLHGGARTIAAVRRAIKQSQERLISLASRYGINPKTVAKWKRRTCVHDLPTGSLLMGFRETVLPSCWFERRLRAVRDRVFLVVADLLSDARRVRVRFVVPAEERTEFLQRLRTLSEGLPIAAQLEWDLTNEKETNQIAVYAVNVPVPTVQPSPHTLRASQ